MPPLPDPQELRAVAARIAAKAAAARAEAAFLQAAVAGVRWHGTAATAFDLLSGDVIGGLRRSATRLDDAADALRRHADSVEHALGLLLRAGSDGLAIGRELIHGVADEFAHPSRLFGDAGSLLGHTESLVRDVGSMVGIG